MAFEIAATPIVKPCLSDKPLWPSTVCYYLVEIGTKNAVDKPVIEALSKTDTGGTTSGGRITHQWWNNLHEDVLDEIDVVNEYVLSRQEQDEFQTRVEEQLAECKTQRMMQQLTQGLMLMDPTLAIRVLTGDDTLAVTHIGPMTLQVYKCKTVVKFQVWWKGQNEKSNCYSMTPVTLPDGCQFYLKPGAKELIAHTERIHCENRPKFVAGYASKAAPLEQVVQDTIQERTKYTWTKNHQKAFDQLKEALHNAPCLTHPSKRETDVYHIFVDASGWAIGAVLT